MQTTYFGHYLQLWDHNYNIYSFFAVYVRNNLGLEFGGVPD